MIKKILITFFVLLLLLILFFGLAPNLLKLETVRVNIADMLSKQLGSEFVTTDIRWVWLPFPHLSLLNARINNAHTEATLPEVSIYPDWLSALRTAVKVDKIRLKNPHIHIKELAVPKERTISLPQTRIVVENGLLTFKAGLIMPDVLKSGTLSYSITESELLIEQDRLKFSFQGNTPFSKNINILGQVNFSDHSYLLKIDCQRLMLYHSVTSLADGKLIPVEPEVNLTGYVKGVGLDSFQAGLKGSFPCFVVKPRDRELLVNCGSADMYLEKTGGLLSLKIDQLEVKEPGLTLQGVVERRVQEPSQAPLWHINLNASDLNLSEIRQGVLTLWGNNKIAAEVCGIVLGGKAKAASFLFDGPASDLEHIENMTITADVADASIHVPKADLALTRANGPILIKKGILSGLNLGAWLGESEGKNCSLLLGLTKEDHTFKLDIDLDADIASIPAILHNVIHNTAFLDELDKFSNITGRASGHLNIGDNLKKSSVRITVDEMQANTNYDRLPWPIDIKQGTLSIAPKQVKWHEIQAVMGHHTVHASSGTVSWDTELYMDISQLAATLDSESFYSELHNKAAVPKRISTALATIRGSLNLKKTMVHGPVRIPEKWEYHLDVQTDDLQLTSSLLPFTVNTDKASFSISDTDLTLTDCPLRLAGNRLKLKGNLKHSLLEHWHGELEVNGTVYEDLTAWIKTKNWVPELFFPRIPCTLKNFHVFWDTSRTEVGGGIIAGKGGSAAPMVLLDVVSSPDQLLIKGIDFIAREEQGHLSLDLRHTASPGTLVDWRGSLSADTLDKLLENNILLGGTLKGNCRLDTIKGASAPSFKGFLSVADLSWHWEEQAKKTAVVQLFLLGKQGRINVEKINLLLDQDSIILHGIASPTADGLQVQLALTAPTLNLETAQDFLSDLDSKVKKIARHKAKPHIGPHALSPWDITGEINFTVDSFSSSLQNAMAKTDKSPSMRTWKPFSGRIELHPQQKSTTHIKSSNLCGIDMTGTWYSDETLGQNSISFLTPSASRPLFQNVLSCLGIKQNVVEGSFDCDITLQGQPDQWTDGSVKIFSSQGRILRMTLLSQLFKVINITDLFSANDPSSLGAEGFAYSELDLQAAIRNNRLFIQKAIIRGEGLNLFGKGELDLHSLDSDITILIAPLKTIDSLVGKVPLVGRAVGGKNTALVTIPVGVKGNIREPEITLLPPQAVGNALLNLFKDTVKLPFTILNPILTNEEKPEINSNSSMEQQSDIPSSK